MDGNKNNPHLMLLYDGISNYLKANDDTRPRKNFQIGQFVMIEGISEESDQSLNETVGLLCGYDPKLECNIVQIADGSSEGKKVKIYPRYLVNLPLRDSFLAMFYTMEESAQWAMLNNSWNEMLKHNRVPVLNNRAQTRGGAVMIVWSCLLERLEDFTVILIEVVFNSEMIIVQSIAIIINEF